MTSSSPSADSVNAAIQQVVQRIVDIVQPDRIILFGSAARGEMGPDSDIDLLVVKAGIADRGRLTEEIYLRLPGVGIPVDVIVVTPEDIERFKDRVGTIIRPAMRDGREIYAA